MNNEQEVTNILTEANLQTSYWGKKIIAAAKRGHFTESNKEQALDWVTCACGKLDDAIPRYRQDWSRYGEPLDERLAFLGTAFSEAIDWGDHQDAAHCLIDIEERAIEVLRG
jgi:hypothetical protein